MKGEGVEKEKVYEAKQGDGRGKEEESWSLARIYWRSKPKWDADGVTEEEAAYTFGAFVSASMAGTPPALKSFVLAMLWYPAWQEILCKEVERVAGETGERELRRCWVYKDRMPIARAVVKEVLRWRPAMPNGAVSSSSISPALSISVCCLAELPGEGERGRRRVD